ncbi:MAG: recombinase family protein [Defluviitaleaceae bacterium]|nr:recombinase family protein [Defluviitaleaceae bacterium]
MKVTAYCRVSTDTDDQKNSLENQAEYFKAYIEAVPSWEYVAMYVDEGLSGTSTKKRENFNRMLADAHAGKFDIILTKEVSRFARNTVDTLQYTRELKNIGVEVRFITDGFSTFDKDGELRLTIIAGLAQEESRRISERVRFGQKQSMKKGVVFGQKILGYRREGKGHATQLEIIPEEAETVRLIFHKYLEESKGLTTIAREMEFAEILTGYGKPRWDATAVLRILSNEKYCGDLKQRKFITPNFLTHETKRNSGEEELIIIKNNHTPIISRETFDKTQAEIKRRGVSEKLEKSRYTTRYAFSGKLKCGICGSNYVNRNTKSTNGKRIIQRWRCANSMKNGTTSNNANGCDSKMIRNEILEQAFLSAIKAKNKDEIIKDCTSIISSVLDESQLHTEQATLKKRIQQESNRITRLIDLRIDGEITKEELSHKREALDKKINALKARLHQQQATTTKTTRDKIKTRIKTLANAETFNEEIARELLEKIIIHNKSRCEVYLRD